MKKTNDLNTDCTFAHINGNNLDIQSLNIEVLQIPSDQNKYHAVAKQTVIFKTGESYSAIGSAFPNSNIPGFDTLKKAQELAMEKVLNLAQQVRKNTPYSNQQVESSHPSEIASSPSNTPRVDGIDKSKWNGGGNKPITQRQIDLIKRRAEECHTNADDLVRHKFGKSLPMLNGSEANEVIQHLKKESIY